MKFTRVSFDGRPLGEFMSTQRERAVRKADDGLARYRRRVAKVEGRQRTVVVVENRGQVQGTSLETHPELREREG